MRGDCEFAQVAVGPFAVLNAVRQQGTITVTAPTDLRLRYQTRGEMGFDHAIRFIE